MIARGIAGRTGEQMIIRLRYKNGSTTDFIWTTEHPASHYGLGVLLRKTNQKAILDGNQFRILRSEGARIETDDPVKVCGALGVPEDEEGIVQI